jgi:hypothetical protein
MYGRARPMISFCMDSTVRARSMDDMERECAGSGRRNPSSESN